jgi:hypothetical protein
MFFIIFIFIFICKFIYSRILTDQNLITTIKPKFEKTSTENTNDKCIIHFQVINNYIHEISYQLYISELNNNLWSANLSFYKNWEFVNDDYFKIMRNDDLYWKDWVVGYSGNKRIITLNNLNSSKI